jgi:hypothetical protein
MIVDEVEQQSEADDPQELLETTVALVRQLLRHGLLAGDSPAQGSSTQFHAWPDQDPEAVALVIRREWTERGGPPDWGDGPWFAMPHAPAGHA